MPVCILGDLIADLSVRVDTFPITAQDLHPVSYLELGPGGATNIAIMAARFGLAVSCFGELGKDPFGDIVWKGLQREHIETEHILVSPQTRTPVAGVVVDEQREPAYLGYQGELHTLALPSAWRLGTFPVGLRHMTTSFIGRLPCRKLPSSRIANALRCRGLPQTITALIRGADKGRVVNTVPRLGSPPGVGARKTVGAVSGMRNDLLETGCAAGDGRDQNGSRISNACWP